MTIHESIEGLVESVVSESEVDTIRGLLRDRNGWTALGLSDPAYTLSDGTPKGDRGAAEEVAYLLGWENPELPFARSRTMTDLSVVAKADGFLPSLKKSYRDGQRDA